MDGYSIAGGLYYRLEILGDLDQRISQGDSVFYELSDSSGFLLQANCLFDSTHNGIFLRDILPVMGVGDVATVILTSEIMENLGLKNNQEHKFQLRIDSVFTPQVCDERKKYRQWRNDAEMNEAIGLKAYLLENNIASSSLHEGLYLLALRQGKGPCPGQGSEIRLHYIGKFLDGEEFDNTYIKNEPLEFQMGKPDQVIMGIERALPYMQKGGKYRIILPSHLAFGENGSATGIVPPFTSVVFDVEVVSFR